MKTEPRPAPALDPRAARLLRIIRDHRVNTGLRCVHCSCERVHCWGTFSGRQRYRCTACRRTFSDLTGTPLSRTKRLHLWPRYFVSLQHAETIRASAQMLGVHLTTTFRWRHRFLAAVNSRERVALKGEVEVLNYVLPWAEKGQRRLGRRRFARGLRGTGRIERPDRYVIVLHARDRSGASVQDYCDGRYAPVAADYCHLLDRHLPTMSCLIARADVLSAFGVYARARGVPYMLTRRQWRDAPAAVHRAGAHLFNVSEQHERLKDWLYGFRGVSSRYLHHYLAWHRFLERTHEELIGTRWLEAGLPPPTVSANIAYG